VPIYPGAGWEKHAIPRCRFPGFPPSGKNGPYEQFGAWGGPG